MRIQRHAVASLLLIACTTAEPKEPIQLGLVSSLEEETGMFAGETLIAGLAVEEINKQGGINGHTLELVIKDGGDIEETSTQRIRELIDEGAVGTVGPAYSSAVLDAAPVARDHKFPIMSQSATAPVLSTVDDDGYVFRAMPNDQVQSLAMAYYMTEVASPRITRVALIQEIGTYGNGLADAFEAAFAKAGGTVQIRVRYEWGEPADSEAVAAGVMDQLDGLAERPELIVLVGDEGDAAALVTVWSQRPSWRDVSWFFTDGLRLQSFLGKLPSGCAGMLGSAPTFPTLGDSYRVLRDAYSAKYPDGELDQESFAPNVWDSVYLFATALVAQDVAGEAFGGEGLRDQLTKVSKGPGLILHAGQWRDIVGTLRRGNDVDYDGASGPLDLDATGEALGPYEVWRIAPDAASYKFEQQLYIDAAQLAELRGK